jgi:hypothetical protein
VLAIAVGASVAAAQDMPAEDDGEDIVDTGSIVAAQKALIEAKREAVNVADIESADAAAQSR